MFISRIKDGSDDTKMTSEFRQNSGWVPSGRHYENLFAIYP